MSTADSGFADYCCELLVSLGPCRAKRMFGGWGISCDGLTVAIIADLGDGDTLWLKASADTRTIFEAEGCKRFIYTAKGVARGMNYYSAPADAMESPALMQDWARLAWQAALAARKPQTAKAKSKPAPGRPKPV
jgi:DNA transformation protein